jgi:hydroxymethylbilane synthase
MHLTIGSRGSDLALYQANLIKKLLSNPGIEIDIKIIKTTGDKIDTLSFDKMEGKNFFTKELEEALLAGKIDLAVHSLKDLSTTFPEGLKVAAYCNPEDPSELLLIRPEKLDEHRELFLKPGSSIGTSSVRRQAQIAYHRPDLKIMPLRGNVPTRVKKLMEKEYDAILLARAGVERLRLETGNLKAIVLNRHSFIPAPGQGILAIETRENDPTVESIVSRLNDIKAESTAKLERGLLARFQGGCQLPLAVTSDQRDGRFFLKAFLGIQKGGIWDRPVQYSGDDANIELLIDKAFDSLNAQTGSVQAVAKKKILITRHEEDGSKYFEQLKDDADIIYYPVFQIVPIDYEGRIADEISSLEQYDWIIFTSRNTVKIFADYLRESRSQIGGKTKIAAIGRKTAEYLISLGYSVAFVPEEESSQGLIRELPSAIGQKDLRILLPQGEEAPDILDKELSRLGYNIKRLNIYKTIAAKPDDLPSINSNMIDFFIFTSPLSVQFFQDLRHSIRPNSWVAAIGIPTAEALKGNYRAADYIPPKADLNDIACKIKELIRNEN